MKNLLIVLSSAVLSAVLLALFFVLNFGPTGSYPLENALIEPSVVASFNYNDYDPKTYESDRYIFDKIEVQYTKEGSFKKSKISIDQYRKIYDLLKGDKSLLNVDPKVLNEFKSAPLIRLVIYVKTESPSGWQKNSKEFQSVEFVNGGDYFRVMLHEDKGGLNYAYFYRKAIANKIEEILSL